MPCRLCLSTLSNDYENFVENQELFSKIKSNLSVEISIMDNFDKLPTTVCLNCIIQINNWCKFQEMCLNSQKILKSQLTNQEKTKNKVITNFKRHCIEEIQFDDVKVEWKEEIEDELSSDIENSIEDINKDKLDNMLIDTIFQFSPFTYQCNICLKEFDACLDYLEHQDEHEGKPLFRCDECDEAFSTKKELANHEQCHKKCHKLPCSICGKLVLQLSMKLHLISHTDRYKCPRCNHRFSSNSTLEQHIITVHTDKRDHVCDFCGKSFSSKSSLTTHSKIHKEEREYKCKLCDYAGHTASAIYTHMSKHVNETHNCEICGKIFKSYRNLYDHLRRVHTKEKKHDCPHCGIKFIQKYMLNVHMRTHTGVRPYKCELCEKTFIRSDSLKEHLATHGPRTAHICIKCSKKFMTKKGRERHNCTGNDVNNSGD